MEVGGEGGARDRLRVLEDERARTGLRMARTACGSMSCSCRKPPCLPSMEKVGKANEHKGR